MVTIPFAEVLRANERIERYRFRLEYSPPLIYEGSVDRRSARAHVLLGLNAERFPQVETYWQGDQGLGRKLGTDVWLHLQSHPLPDYLDMALTALREAQPVEVSEVDGDWKLTYQLEHIPIRDNAAGYLTHLFGEPRNQHEREFFERAVELAQQVNGQITMRVSRGDLLIQEISSQVQAGEVQAGMVVRFQPLDEELPPPPMVTAPDKPEVAAEALMLRLERLTGWYDLKTHGPWAECALSLIADTDKLAGKYREIYDSSWEKEEFTENVARDPKTTAPNETKHHPVVVGSYYEDQTGAFPDFYKEWFDNDAQILANPNFSANGYMRDYHHYGGHDKGVEYEWYYSFRGYPPTTVGNAYYSARDWGYGIDNALNRLTFQEAIHQYNRQTWEGRRAAYLILGHLVHLLQDVAQPDHGRLVPHAGSGMDRHQAYERYSYCHIVAAEAAAVACAACWGIGCFICGPAAFGIAEAACWGSADSDVMGYEKLVGEKFELSQVDSQIKAAGVLKKDTYQEYFHALCDFAMAEADKANLSSPLGCTWLKLIPPVPGADPDIQSDDAADSAPYMNLTKAIIPKIVGLSAGLMDHFYEIANPPPYVQRVVVVKGAAGLTPIGFAKFDSALQGSDCSKVQACYDATWKESGLTRSKQVTVNRPVSPAHQAYIFLQFGPCIAPVRSKVMNTSTLSLKLTDTAPGSIPVTVSLKAATDSQIGTYYWGSTQPVNATAQNCTLTLEISGEDASAHFSKRTYPGAVLDSNPATVAYADHTQTPLHPLKNYEPDSDKKHSIAVGPAIVADSLEVNNTFAQATAVQLGVSQNSWSGAPMDPGTAVYQNLTLHNQADVDYFAVAFQIDKWDAGGGGYRKFDIGSGLYGEYCPAELAVKIEEAYGACPLAEVYHSNQTLYKQYTSATSFTIEAPVGIFTDQKFFLVVKNPDFSKQGPLVYTLKLRYTPSYIAIRGRLLYKFWEYTRPGPIPPEEWQFGVALGDPPEVLMYRDFQRLVEDLERFIPRQLDDLGIVGNARLEEESRLQVALADITCQARMYGDAERLYQLGANGFHQAGSIQGETSALRGLQTLYGELDRQTDYERISQALIRLTNT